MANPDNKSRRYEYVTVQADIIDVGIVGRGMVAEVRFLSDKITEKAFWQYVTEEEYPNECTKRSIIRGAHELIGMRHRLDGNLVAAKAAYQQAASREWGDHLDYSSADRGLEKTEKAIMAMNR